MPDHDQRRLLGDFLRAHRERLRPDARAGRRRTPGLRREELAERAGISATWFTWIEQGRDVQASPQALGRLAKALSLTSPERAYLFELAGRHDPELPLPVSGDEAPEALGALVGCLPHPAYGLDRLWTACCWNEPAAWLFRGWLSDGEERNLLRFVFLSPGARRLIPDWEVRAHRLLGEFRADYGHGHSDPRVRGLVEDLRVRSAAFARAWDAQGVLERVGGPRTFRHPEAGLLRFRQHSLSLAERPDFKLVVLIPD